MKCTPCYDVQKAIQHSKKGRGKIRKLQRKEPHVKIPVAQATKDLKG